MADTPYGETEVHVFEVAAPDRPRGLESELGRIVRQLEDGQRLLTGPLSVVPFLPLGGGDFYYVIATTRRGPIRPIATSPDDAGAVILDRDYYERHSPGDACR